MTGAPAKLKIRAIQWDLVGFDVALLWDAPTVGNAWELSKGISGGIRFADTGAHLTNNTPGATGKLLLATSGLVAGGRGAIYIETQANPNTP